MSEITAIATPTPATMIDSAQLAGNAVAHDLSPFGLFMQADIIVQSVMILLLIGSLWSWAIVFDKAMKMRQLRRQADKFEAAFWNEASLDALYDRVQVSPPDPLAAVFVAGMKEWRTSTATGRLSGALASGLKERVERVMSLTMGREIAEVEKDMGFLATLGSSAPFIGLFGTVWGIMNSFTAIAGKQDTSLAVVAPGIAEALFATAMGLVAAIPSVIFYNKYAGEIGRYAQRVQDFADQFATILSRRLDDRV